MFIDPFCFRSNGVGKMRAFAARTIACHDIVAAIVIVPYPIKISGLYIGQYSLSKLVCDTSVAKLTTILTTATTQKIILIASRIYAVADNSSIY
jgi:hypothetical protein